MGKAYYYDPKRDKEPPKPRYTPKGDGKDWSRELYATFRGTLIPPECYKPEWKEIDCLGSSEPVNPEPVGEKHSKKLKE
ncbi:hypothetical protein FH593_15255 [Leptospira interrogans]|uniref:hypothetical protein n=1 Tax=Leptospira interrogans TaxID=173 RepID=UPI001EEFA4F0|nr:hypothetical protein [Leptospira interrogans]ULG87908.1 hypothetical protein FH593_15255 [Leptospira interrogans]